MAALHVAAFAFITVTLPVGGFGVTDEEFRNMANKMEQLKEEIIELKGGLEKETQRNQEVQELITIQDMDIRREIKRLSAVVARCDSYSRKWKPEAPEHDVVLNNTIEERVTMLESQVVEIEEDVTGLNEDVIGLRFDHTELEGDVNFLFDEQIIQDERLFSLEQTSVEVVVELAEINANILALEITTSDQEVRLLAAEENIQGLQMTDEDHDARISTLEENGGGSQNDTIAFHSAWTTDDTIPDGSTVIFDRIFLNEGNGYDSSTGVFTVPSGGDGVYYFSSSLYGDDGEFAYFHMKLNGDTICSIGPDHNTSGATDDAAASCSAVVNVTAGDEVEVVFNSGTDDTPLWGSETLIYNVFNGFRI